jgi:hypothetical protein
MAVAAELVAHDQIVAGAGKDGGELADVAWHQHRVGIGAGDHEPMRDVGARHPEPDRPAGRESHLGRGEGEHQADDLDFDDAVRLEHRLAELREARIGEDLRRIDGFDVTRRVHAVCDHGHADDGDERRDDHAGRPHPEALIKIDLHGVTAPRDR